MTSITAIREAVGDMVHVGAGTVMGAAQAKAAIKAGAEFLLAPGFEPAMVETAVANHVVAVPGAFTPSEIQAAYRAGAAMVKLFPAGYLGTPYIKAISAPISHVPLMAMGGINAKNMMEYLALPTVTSVGVGSALADLKLIEQKNWNGLTTLARSFTEQLKAR